MLVLFLAVACGQAVVSTVRQPSGVQSCTPVFQNSVSCIFLAAFTRADAWRNPGRVLENGEYARSRNLLPTQYSGWIMVDNFQFSTGTDPRPTVTSNVVGLEVELDVQTDSNSNGRVQLPVGGVRLLSNIGQGFRMYTPLAPKPTVNTPLQSSKTTVTVGGANDLWQSADGFSMANQKAWNQAQFAVAIVAQGSGVNTQLEQMRLHEVRARLFFSDGTTSILTPTTSTMTTTTDGGPLTGSLTTSIMMGNNNGVTSDSGNNKMGLIVGAVVGALLLVALVVVLVVFLIRRRKSTLGMVELSSDALLNYTEFADTTESEFGASTEDDALPRNMIL